VATVISYAASGADHRLEIELPEEFRHLLVYKGSIAVNGVSLTVAEIDDDRFVIWIIPHTHEKTNFCDLRAGSKVNLEFDILAKHVERMLRAPQLSEAIAQQVQKAMGSKEPFALGGPTSSGSQPASASQPEPESEPERVEEINPDEDEEVLEIIVEDDSVRSD
jgi:hypothetical protein